MSMGAVDHCKAMLDHMTQCMSGAKAASVSIPMDGCETMMGHIQAAHEAMTGAKHVPKSVEVQTEKRVGVVYIK